MKQTAIQISINNSVNNNQNGEQRMTSLEIAQLSGKQHKDVLKAIRNMESAWEKVNGRNFALVDYKDLKGELRPCYLLSKTECLYIATKFNDEARAKLVIRWQELEEERLMEMQQPKQKIQEIRLLACDEEVLDEADDILGEELEKLNRESRFCYTPTEIGKAFGLDGRDLNSFLSDQKIIRWARGQWQLTQKYLHRELTANRYSYVHGRDGRRKLVSRLVWTEKGREFVIDLINDNVKI
ncbi:MAG: Rha family transcriptional regulator [Bacteroidales bacterium]|nr:Rha family transcriptional regulator [Bacteroidales bacterium]